MMKKKGGIMKMRVTNRNHQATKKHACEISVWLLSFFHLLVYLNQLSLSLFLYTKCYVRNLVFETECGYLENQSSTIKNLL